ncbi:MAG: hypothetical protein ACFFAJ_09595 [Candidatus Hodarchaeota archaeon]
MSDERLRMEEIIPTIERVKNTIETMKNELEEKEKLLVERESRLNQAEMQKQQLEFEKMSLEAEFKKISDLYQEMAGKQEDAPLDVKQLLSIYITLLEKVFAGQPHAKILYLLHGGKSKMTREELTKTSGFSPAIVLHSLNELNRAELIKFDVEEGIAELETRIFG